MAVRIRPWLLWSALAASWAVVADTAAGDEKAVDGQCLLNAQIEVQSVVEGDGIAEDIKKLCPVLHTSIPAVLQRLYSAIPLLEPALRMLSLWPANVTGDTWADDYVVVNYLIVARILLGLYKVRDASYVKVPTGMFTDPEDVVHVENIFAPHYDVDGSPNFFWFEKAFPNSLKRAVYVPAMTCFYSSLRRLATTTRDFTGDFDDVLDDPDRNTWEAVLRDSIYKTKTEWVMSFYSEAVAWDGTPLWPLQMNDLSTYWKQDEWDDRLEHAMAFHLIGSHRVEYGSWVFKDVAGAESLTLPFRISLNGFSAFDVRDNFGRYGVDLYFNEDGLPVLLQTPSGEYVVRGDTAWQYWKFVWRSTLVTGITLVDHLHFTHLRCGNLLARSSRAALPPTHPLRRILSIFTFGTIFVNVQAMHQLIGPRHGLHRATPFREFEKLSRTVPDGDAGIILDMPDMPGIKTLMNDTMYENLPPLLQAAPFYTDGRLYMGALRKLAEGFTQQLGAAGLFCDAKREHLHPTFAAFARELLNETFQAKYKLQEVVKERMLRPSLSCEAHKDEIIFTRMLAYLFAVTGFHRHVGFVGDYYKDPQLATMSWREGELAGRPKQHMIMTVVNVFTSTRQPKLKEDFTHLFKGMEPDLEEGFTKTWREFQRDLQDVEQEIDRRNTYRDLTNINMSPRVLESSISK